MNIFEITITISSEMLIFKTGFDLEKNIRNDKKLNDFFIELQFQPQITKKGKLV
jgi:hypothetical protein